MSAAYADDLLIGRFIELIREIKRFPVGSELRLKARTDRTFPSHGAFARLGPKRQLASRVLKYCKVRDGLDDVIALCVPIAQEQAENAPAEEAVLDRQTDSFANTREGHVYMARCRSGARNATRSAKRF